MSERKGEEALQALLAAVAPIGDEIEGGEICRNPETELPVDEDQRWKLVVRDGTTGDPEVSLSPPSYHYSHEAALAITVVKTGAGDADALFSEIVGAIVDALDDDQTLGGKVDWAEPGELNTDEADQDVLAGFKAAILPVTLYYTTSKPLG